jgi:hypothetical protein
MLHQMTKVPLPPAHHVAPARDGPVWRSTFSAVAVAAAFGLHQVLAAWVGPGLPPYILFYPTVIAVALLAGWGPGMAATAP